MKSYITLSSLATLMVLPLVWSMQDFYNSKYDTFDIKPLLENDRILLSYTKCFLDNGPCTPDAKDFKKVIPEALETTCGKCSPAQRQLIRTVIRRLKEKYPESWKELVDRYDKDMKHRDSFNKFLEQDS